MVFSKKSLLYKALLISICITNNNYGVFRGQNSYIHMSPGGTFVVANPLTFFNGKLIRDNGGVLSMVSTLAPVLFTGGIFEDNGNDVTLQATLASPTSIVLSGNQLFRGEPGSVSVSLTVSGQNNRVDGQPVFSNDITLYNLNTTLTLAIQSDLNCNIQLNGGGVYLENSLALKENKTFVGTGTVNLEGRTLKLTGASIKLGGIAFYNAYDIMFDGRLTLTGNVSFLTATSYLNGTGGILYLGGNSLILGDVTTGTATTLFLHDTEVQDLAQGSIVFAVPSSTVNLSDASFSLISSITFTTGNIVVEGPSTWFLKNNYVYFTGSSLLTVSGVTLCLDRAGAPTMGGLVFTSTANYSMVASGTIANCSAETGNNTSRIGALESCCSAVQGQLSVISTSTNTLSLEPMLLTLAARQYKAS